MDTEYGMSLGLLIQGFPSRRSYLAQLESDLFRKMEAYSWNFLDRNEDLLEDYATNWSPDPLHHWSRQWEYPYVYRVIDKLIMRDQRPLRILDAGSGLTFLPHFLMQSLKNVELHCVDRNETYAYLNEIICARQGSEICYKTQELQKLEYPDECFDMIYCISVLEHTDSYDEITEQLHRVLKPCGLLVLSIDISLDLKGDLPLEEAEELISFLSEKFCPVGNVDLRNIFRSLNPRKVLTTSFAYSLQRKTWPIKRQIMYLIRKLLRPYTIEIPFGNLTIFCALLLKPGINKC